MDSQKAAVLGNRVLLMLAAQKADGAESALSGFAARFPEYGRLPLLQAALLAHAGKVHPTPAELLPQPCAQEAMRSTTVLLTRSKTRIMYVPERAPGRRSVAHLACFVPLLGHPRLACSVSTHMPRLWACSWRRRTRHCRATQHSGWACRRR